jgi:hypothetical protein
VVGRWGSITTPSVRMPWSFRMAVRQNHFCWRRRRWQFRAGRQHSSRQSLRRQPPSDATSVGVFRIASGLADGNRSGSLGSAFPILDDHPRRCAKNDGMNGLPVLPIAPIYLAPFLYNQCGPRFRLPLDILMVADIWACLSFALSLDERSRAEHRASQSDPIMRIQGLDLVLEVLE